MKHSIPLYLRIVIGVSLGVAFGLAVPGSSAQLSEIGKLVLVFLKALATPLIFFAVVDACLRISIPATKGLKLIGISLCNAVVAITIGLAISNITQAGTKAENIGAAIRSQTTKTAKVKSEATATEKKPTLDLVENIKSFVPESIIAPFAQNSVISVVILALVFGSAFRRVRESGDDDIRKGASILQSSVSAIFQMLLVVLHWLVQLVPFAVFGVVAGVVAKTGAKVFADLGLFLMVMAAGLFIHAVLYYSLLLAVVARKSPLWFFPAAVDPIVTALSASSSLATLPVTLKCLDEKLKVSPDSARLAACVGTNLNHDGIILYEAAAALFIAQCLGYHLTFSQQISVALASVMAGVGIAGVPEAGLITLPLVLKAAGLPDAVAVAVFGVILPVDWILGRCRAATNVISDMVVAVILDKVHPTPAIAMVDASDSNLS